MDLIYWDHYYNAVLLVNLAVIIALFACLRLFSGAVSRINASDELLRKDNPAFGISLTGATLGLLTDRHPFRRFASRRKTQIDFVFSNLELDGQKLRFTLRKPFDLFVKLSEGQEWRPLRDSNPCYRRERAMS